MKGRQDESETYVWEGGVTWAERTVADIVGVASEEGKPITSVAAELSWVESS